MRYPKLYSNARIVAKYLGVDIKIDRLFAVVIVSEFNTAAFIKSTTVNQWKTKNRCPKWVTSWLTLYKYKPANVELVYKGKTAEEL
jgi:hypothetical protein